MTHLIDRLTSVHGLPLVDETTVDVFLAASDGESAHAILFFTGDPTERTDSFDVAVVLPELVAVFAGRYRAAVIARSAEKALMPRFQVMVLPSLAVTRGGTIVGVLPRIRDWSEYVEKLAAWLAPDTPALRPAGRPKVEITHNGKEIAP
ncbi:MAG: hydrogenase accessory protein [Ancalomicrobiaceae bacterium]|nr:hydrogenase accessory protein [Ancalomicrobiaceae bacterium]